MRSRALCLSLTLLALACAWPAAADEYLALRFLPAEKPGAYVHVIRDVAWVASSPDGGSATTFYADPKQTQKWADRESGGKGTTYIFQALAIPSPDPHLKVTARLWVQRIQFLNTQRQRGRPFARAYIEYTFGRVDEAGVVWTYDVGIQQPSNEPVSVAPSAPTVYDVPALTGAKLTLDPQIEGYQARLGMTLFVGEVRVMSLKKGATPAAAHLQVYDADGKLVHEQDGNLEKFGFT